MSKEENNKDIMDFILSDKETYDKGFSVVKDSMVMKNWFVIT